MSSSDKTFVRITNKDIYNSITELHKKHDELCKSVSRNSRIINNCMLGFKTVILSSFLWIAKIVRESFIK